MRPEVPPDGLAERIAAESRLDGFARLDYVPEVQSTNDLALQRAASGAPEGTAVLADLQRSGRGRRGRAWHSPPGAGMYLSTVARPPHTALSLVTLAAGIAAAEGVTQSTGLPVHLKWPNDLVVGNDWRKLGGVLCEAVTSGQEVSAVVIGVGINLRPAAYPPEVARRATSIEGELGRPVDRAALVVETLVSLRGVLDQLRAGAVEAIVVSWRRLAATGTFGGTVFWTDARGDHRGTTRDVAADGALLVEAGAGLERVVAGEVTWERRA